MPDIGMYTEGVTSGRKPYEVEDEYQRAIAARVARERKLHELQRFADLMDSLEPEVAAETAAREEAFKMKRTQDLNRLESPGDSLLASVEPTLHNQVLGTGGGINDSVDTALKNVASDMYYKEPLLSKVSTGKMAGKSLPAPVATDPGVIAPGVRKSVEEGDKNKVSAATSQKLVGLAGSRLGNIVGDQYGEMLMSAPTPNFKAQVMAEKLADIRPQILSGSEDPDTMEALLTGEMKRYGDIASGDATASREYNKEAMRTSAGLLGKMESSSAKRYAAESGRNAKDAMAEAMKYAADVKRGIASEANRTKLIDILRKSVNDQMNFDAEVFGHKLGYLKSQMVSIYMGKKGIEAFDDLNQMSTLLARLGKTNLASIESAIAAAGAGDTAGQATALRSAQAAASDAAVSKAYDAAKYAEVNGWFQSFASRFLPGGDPPSESELDATLAVLKTAVEGLAKQSNTNLEGWASRSSSSSSTQVNTDGKKPGGRKKEKPSVKKDLSGGIADFE